VWERGAAAQRDREWLAGISNQVIARKHVVERADRNHVAVGPPKRDRNLTTELLRDGGGDKGFIFQKAEPLVQVGREWLCRNVRRAQPDLRFGIRVLNLRSGLG
jgi:hypothetical protein